MANSVYQNALRKKGLESQSNVWGVRVPYAPQDIKAKSLVNKIFTRLFAFSGSAGKCGSEHVACGLFGVLFTARKSTPDPPSVMRDMQSIVRKHGDTAVRSYDRTAADWNGRGERILPEDTILRFEPNNEFMDCILIETRAYDELHALITRLTSRISELAALSNVSPLPQRWMTSEEVCKALSITPRALQYYRLRGIVPFTFIGNKVLFKEADIRHVLDSNLIKTV